MKKLFTLFALLSALFLGATNSYAFKGESADYHPVIESAHVKGKGFSIIYPNVVYFRDEAKNAFIQIPDKSILYHFQKGNTNTLVLIGGEKISFTHESVELGQKFYADLNYMINNSR